MTIEHAEQFRQSVAHSHYEAAANALIGLMLAQLVLWLWGIPIVEALWLNAVMMAVSYARSYALRRIFARFE